MKFARDMPICLIDDPACFRRTNRKLYNGFHLTAEAARLRARYRYRYRQGAGSSVIRKSPYTPHVSGTCIKSKKFCHNHNSLYKRAITRMPI
jgi:hypothetical protein